MKTIEVDHLKKYYTTYDKELGLAASLKSLFNRKYYTVKAVDDVSFSIQSGELIGFIGPNGAGKTTVLKCLSGILVPTEGTISILGARPQDRLNTYKRKIGFVTGQKNQLFWDLPPIETFYLNKAVYEIDETVFKKNYSYLVELLQVSNVIKTPTRKLSLGERMKCELIAALLHDPEVLFLDEPTIGLDVVAQKNIQDFIRIYNREKHATILLTSHSMQDVKRLCERIIIINKGAIIFDGKLSEVIKMYEETKKIVVDLSEPVDEKKLGPFRDKMAEFTYPQIRFSVTRSSVPSFVEKLLKYLPVSDLNVEELPLEDAIGKIFTTSLKKDTL